MKQTAPLNDAIRSWGGLLVCLNYNLKIFNSISAMPTEYPADAKHPVSAPSVITIRGSLSESVYIYLAVISFSFPKEAK